MNQAKDFTTRSGLIVKVCLVFVFVSQALTAQDLYDLKNSREFSGYLMQSGQFSLAVPEFRRVLFFCPDDSLARINLLIALRRSGDPAGALDQLKTWFGTEPPRSFAIEGIKSSIMDQRFDLASDLLESAPDIPETEQAYYRMGLGLLTWSGDENTLPEEGRDPSPGYAKLLDVRTQASQMKMKSPALALAMSAVIPGLGKVYSKDWKDGLFSLMFIGGNVLQAYRGFSKFGTGNPYGWIFGTLAVGFYGANLYGSWKSAADFNRRQLEYIQDETGKLLHSRF